jgi:pimeloyl-ACP methyl ester carboxylesterase
MAVLPEPGCRRGRSRPANDRRELRRAVGDTGLNYVGYSYGTYLGATYANLFSGKVRALALDANTDPSAYPLGRGYPSHS